MEFEYSDSDIHEDLYQIIKYSCGEVCTTTDQLDKVMRVWTTFLEPIFGVPPRPQGAEDSEDVVNAKSLVRSIVASVGESNGSPGHNIAINNIKQPNSLSIEDGKILPEQASFLRDRLENGEKPNENSAPGTDRIVRTRDAFQSGKLSNGVHVSEETSVIISHANSNERISNNNASVYTRSEQNHGIAATPSRPSAVDCVLEPGVGNEAFLPQGGDSSSVVATNGMMAEASKVVNSINYCKPEREEGELSPNGDFEEDNFGVYRDNVTADLSKSKEGSASKKYKVGNGQKEICSREAGGENGAGAYDGEVSARRLMEDSENASEAGEDVSGSESGEGDECSREDHEEDEDVDHDTKAESEGEAEGTADAHDVEGDGLSLPFSERFLHSVKPLAKHFPSSSNGKKSVVELQSCACAWETRCAWSPNRRQICACAFDNTGITGKLYVLYRLISIVMFYLSSTKP